VRTPIATPRHVLFLNWRDTRHPEGGGSEVYVERIAAELVILGYRATLFCAAHGDASAEETNPAGVRILRRGGRHTVYLRAALTYLAGACGLGRLAARHLGRPDVIVDVGNGIPFLAPLYARKPVVALVHHVHREQWPIVLPAWQARLGWWIESRLAVRTYRRCRYVAVSNATREELVALGVDAGRISIVHNGTPEAPTVTAARSARPLLLLLGRLVPHKQVEVALRTVAALVEEFPTVQLVVAGSGWWEPRLQRLAATLGVADRVRFAGFVAEEEKHALFCAAWVALTPSLKEGWGLTIVEAGARETPAVAFRAAGGVTEALVDGVTGLLADDADDFVEKVQALLTDEPQRRAMGVAAREHAARFTWAAAGEGFAAVLAGTAGIPAQARRQSYLVP
jgi:glycosyltransferase involved in cell wall biosynthesis